LALSAVAAWFAIEGIMVLFAGMPFYGMIMGIVVEAGKVVGITWIYRHWTHKTKLKFVMIPVTMIAVGLTSMGIFGLLSKAHIEQTAPVANNGAQIERLDQRIGRERSEILDAENIIAQLDQTVQVLVDASKISHPTEGSRVVRINQQPQRDQLKAIIDSSFDSIDEYEDTKLALNQELNALELEVGPVKYIAAIIYDNPEDSLEEAVRMVIIAFIVVFDPMAILLLMAGNYTIMGRVGAAPEPTPQSPKKPRKVTPNATMEFVPAEVIAEVMAEELEKKENRDAESKAKSVEVPAEPEEKPIKRTHTATAKGKFG
jgi:hypothetical protein